MYYTNVAVLCCCLRMLENFIWRPRETRNTVNNKCEHGTRSFDAQQTHETLRGITFCVSSSLIIWLEGRKLRFFTSSQNCAESPAKLLSRLYIYLHYIYIYTECIVHGRFRPFLPINQCEIIDFQSLPCIKLKKIYRKSLPYHAYWYWPWLKVAVFCLCEELWMEVTSFL